MSNKDEDNNEKDDENNGDTDEDDDDNEEDNEDCDIIEDDNDIDEIKDENMVILLIMVIISIIYKKLYVPFEVLMGLVQKAVISLLKITNT